jgi:hypothetical protein
VRGPQRHVSTGNVVDEVDVDKCRVTPEDGRGEGKSRIVTWSVEAQMGERIIEKD